MNIISSKRLKCDKGNKSLTESCNAVPQSESKRQDEISLLPPRSLENTNILIINVIACPYVSGINLMHDTDV